MKMTMIRLAALERLTYQHVPSIHSYPRDSVFASDREYYRKRVLDYITAAFRFAKLISQENNEYDEGYGVKFRVSWTVLFDIRILNIVRAAFQEQCGSVNLSAQDVSGGYEISFNWGVRGQTLIDFDHVARSEYRALKLFQVIGCSEMVAKRSAIEKAIRKGDNINYSGPMDRTSVYAVSDPQDIPYLQARGVNLNHVDRFGLTPLDVAIILLRFSADRDLAFVDAFRCCGAKTGAEVRHGKAAL